MKVLFFALCLFSADAAAGSSQMLRWLLRKAPGTYASELRTLGHLVSWDDMSVSMSGVSFKNIVVRGEVGGAPLFEAESIDCECSRIIWRETRIVIRLSVASPKLVVKAYDVQVSDTNWRRLCALLSKLSLFQGEGHSFCYGVASLDFDGIAKLSFEPCDRLGGRDLRTTLELNWLHDLAPLSKAIASKKKKNGYLTFEELSDMITVDVKSKIAATLRDLVSKAAPQRNSAIRSMVESRVKSAKIGDFDVKTLADAGKAMKRTAVDRIMEATRNLFSMKRPETDRSAISDLFIELSRVALKGENDVDPVEDPYY